MLGQDLRFVGLFEIVDDGLPQGIVFAAVQIHFLQGEAMGAVKLYRAHGFAVGDKIMGEHMCPFLWEQAHIKAAHIGGQADFFIQF